MSAALSSTNTTIVVPCFNESSRLHFPAVEQFLEQTRGIRLLFVDDGSEDATASMIAAFAAGWAERVSLFRMAGNSGKAEAVRAGVNFALSNFEQQFVGFWDADLATPLQAVVPFIAVLESSEFDVVVGSRVKLCGRHIFRKPARHYLGRVFATVVSTILGVPIYDTQCGAKLFRVNATMRDVFAIPFRSRWVFDVEILARLLQFRTAKELEYKVYEYPLETWRDVAGSKLKPWDFLQAILEVLAIQRRYMGTRKRDGM